MALESRNRRLVALLIVCVAGRGAYVLYLVRAHAVVTRSGDAPSYLLPARQLLDHARFDSASGLPEFLRTPGYPAFIAAVYRLFGQTIAAVLLASADSDDRVDPMHARKFAAALQAASAGGPVLLRIEKNSGHGGADLVKANVEKNADQLAFALANTK